eukprot:11315803-Alexandrium_andersonii.AAC.1
MCIRDSLSAPCPWRRSNCGHWNLSRHLCCGRPTSLRWASCPSAPCSDTVSYTHLRAHETSAHL